jgi:hypothetical protein
VRTAAPGRAGAQSPLRTLTLVRLMGMPGLHPLLLAERIDSGVPGREQAAHPAAERLPRAIGLHGPGGRGGRARAHDAPVVGNGDRGAAIALQELGQEAHEWRLAYSFQSTGVRERKPLRITEPLHASLDHGEPHAWQVRVEVAHRAESLPAATREAALVLMLGPGDEAVAEGVAEAGRAVAWVGGVEVFAAHPKVVLEVLAGAHVGDPDPIGRRAAHLGAGLDREAEHVEQDEDGAAPQGEAAKGSKQAGALELQQEHVQAPEVAADERVM